MATNEQKQVADWMKAFGQEVPDKPTMPSLETRKLRAKLILEEALETIVEGLGIDLHIAQAPNILSWLLGYFKQGEFFEYTDPSLTQILDGCEDLKVVTEGTLAACGLLCQNDKEQAIKNGKVFYGGDDHFNEVMRSNWSKLWTADEVVDYETTYASSHPDNKPAPLFFELTTYNHIGGRNYIAKDTSGKVIKSPSYSPSSFNL